MGAVRSASHRRRIAHDGGVILAQDGSWRFFDRGGDGGEAGRVFRDADRTVGDFGRLARQGFFSLRRVAQMNSRWRWRLSMRCDDAPRRPLARSGGLFADLADREVDDELDMGRTTGPGDAPNESLRFARFSRTGSVRTMAVNWRLIVWLERVVKRSRTLDQPLRRRSCVRWDDDDVGDRGAAQGAHQEGDEGAQ